MIEGDVAALISSVGFPIVMCLLLFYQSNCVIKKNTEVVRELTAMLKGRK